MAWREHPGRRFCRRLLLWPRSVRRWRAGLAYGPGFWIFL